MHIFSSKKPREKSKYTYEKRSMGIYNPFETRPYCQYVAIIIIHWLSSISPIAAVALVESKM